MPIEIQGATPERTRPSTSTFIALLVAVSGGYGAEGKQAESEVDVHEQRSLGGGARAGTAGGSRKEWEILTMMMSDM